MSFISKCFLLKQVEERPRENWLMQVYLENDILNRDTEICECWSSLVAALCSLHLWLSVDFTSLPIYLYLVLQNAVYFWVLSYVKWHTHTPHNHFTALGTLSGTTQVSPYQKKHSSTHTYCGRQSSHICFLHLLWSMASSMFNLRARESFFTISPCFLWFTFWPGTLIHFFTQSLSSFRSNAHTIATCFAVVPRLCHLILVSLSTLYLELFCSLTPYIHLTISSLLAEVPPHFPFFLTGQVSLPCTILRAQLLYNLPLTISDISLMVSNGTNCLNPTSSSSGVM